MHRMVETEVGEGAHLGTWDAILRRFFSRGRVRGKEQKVGDHRNLNAE